MGRVQATSAAGDSHTGTLLAYTSPRAPGLPRTSSRLGYASGPCSPPLQQRALLLRATVVEYGSR